MQLDYYATNVLRIFRGTFGPDQWVDYLRDALASESPPVVVQDLPEGFDPDCLADFVFPEDATITWEETTEERYWEMLEVLPPAFWRSGLFLVGEPTSHTYEDKPTFAAYWEKPDGTFWYASRPLTITEAKGIASPGRDMGFGEYAEGSDDA